MKNLEQRKAEFKEKVFELGEPMERTEAFIEYWAEHNEGGKKMRFEMAKNQPFNLRRRMGTWKKMEKRFSLKTENTKTEFLKARYGIG